ncbi:MAG: hypothetical protein HYW69_02000 [Candidatus Nealsonbacteria bacterium]|nr:hypothetical protein [Candidatus Nealsonbacteria bacterium]
MNLIKKFFGLALLIGGLGIILYGLYSSYNIFTAKQEAPVIFETPKQSSAAQKGDVLDLQSQLQNVLGEQLQGILPAGSAPQLFNLISWSIFAGILMLGGGQISGLGIKLLK